jgi:serine/threonine protein kinase
LSEVGSGAVGAEQAFRGALPAGTRLRSYELVAVLGQGAFGITYLARDVTLGRQVAIKEYLPTSVAFRDGDVRVVARSAALADEFVWGRERFLDEARTLATLEGTPAVVRVIDYLEANGTAYTVMVLAPGETLDWRLRAGTLPAMAIDALLEPLLIGLEQVHALGFLHRDIKPANIIVDGRFHPTLIDFGAARAAMVGRSTALTAIFTPGYAAVEQFTASHQGPWTDIYGLAATLHHAIIGRPPPSAIDRMLDDSYEPLSRLSLAGFSPALLAAIDSGLTVRAQDRPQSIVQWRALLSGSGLRDDVPTVVLAPRVAPTQPARRLPMHSRPLPCRLLERGTSAHGGRQEPLPPCSWEGVLIWHSRPNRRPRFRICSL